MFNVMCIVNILRRSFNIASEVDQLSYYYLQTTIRRAFFSSCFFYFANVHVSSEIVRVFYANVLTFYNINITLKKSSREGHAKSRVRLHDHTHVLTNQIGYFTVVRI